MFKIIYITICFVLCLSALPTSKTNPLSLHDALPIYFREKLCCGCDYRFDLLAGFRYLHLDEDLSITENIDVLTTVPRSEEHTSELQSRPHLVCRLLLEKKKKCI